MERLLIKFSFYIVLVSIQLRVYECCLEKERISLLEIRENILNSGCEIQDNLDSWVNDSSNCCAWDRITCNATSNHVTAISLNYTTGYPLNFTGIVCTLNLSLFHPFQELVTLDLSHNRFYAWTRNGGFERLSSLKKLQVLDLSSNLFNGSILSSVSKLISIKTLILGRNSLTDSLISNELGSLENLEVLDLSYNQFNQTSSLEGLCGLRSLRELGLSYNNFFGHLPPCLGNLTNLQVLDLSFNQFSGSIQHVVSSLTFLKYLFLSGNQFEGLFSFSSLANHTLLEIFELSSGSTMLELETETPLWSPTFQLKVIDLPSANLNVQTRTFPSFLRYQHDLQFIDLSHNRLVGSFPSWILQNNSKLKVLNLMNNSFTGNFELPEIKHGLSYLEISSNNIIGQLPEEIGIVLVNLIHMNLSKNNFEGNIPPSVGMMEVLFVLDLSNNNLSGTVPASLFSKLTSLDSLALSNNSFQGDIFPKIVNMPSLIVLDMKNNNFTGNSNPHLLYLPSLLILDISKNKIAGTIYVQLCNLGSLQLLDLSQNMFSGSLPSCFNASTLRYLFLQKNTLSGQIPYILSRIFNLVTLDLRDNNFSGTIPSWISQFSGLRVLLFGGNALQGHIPPQLCQLRSLNILDLSHNSLYGSIPSCLNNISFGMTEEDEFSSSPVSMAYASPKSYYAFFSASLDLQPPGIPTWEFSEEVVVEFGMKYRSNPYKGDILNFVIGIDLSDNKLTGEIPSEIGELAGTKALNLSYNYLTGSIPVTFSNLKNIESLDLRNNNLSGEIPNELVELNFLGTFDVSYNNLSGKILDKGQFGTFDENSYRGNPGLCGDLIHRSCNIEAEPPQASIEEDDDEGGIDMVWFYWSFFAAYVTILLGIFAILYINRRWRNLWFYYVDVCSIRVFGTVLY